MIEAVELTKKFGSLAALDSISFTIGEGSIFGLVGSNGAGKSTLLRTIAGVYAPTKGKLLVDGESSFENPKIKDRIFFVSDFPFFLKGTSMDTMAVFYAGLYGGWNAAKYDKLASTFPIDRKAKLSTMSKGMQRQAALILALSTSPRYLLLDEAFDGLDPVIRQLLKHLLAETVAELGTSVVISSHNLRELEDVCDHIGLMHKGGILFEDELDNLKLEICKVQAVFTDTPSDEALAAIPGIKNVERRGSMIMFIAKGAKDEIIDKVNSLSPVFSEVLPLTLEEVFISEMEAAGYDINNILGQAQ